jgi:peptidoglycan hydrolase-like protein with peptidoglycan-binding domain
MKKISMLAISGITLFLTLVSVASAATFNTSLGYGSANKSEVLNLQNFLYSNGYLKVQPTGIYLSLTQKAVSDFQASNGITPVSGYFGPLTREVANRQLSVANLPKASVVAQSVTGSAQPGISLANTVQSGNMTIRWQTTNYPALAGVNINLLRKVSSSPKSFAFVRTLAKDTVNDGEESWVPQSSENTNDLYVEVTCSNTYKFPSGCQFGSDPIKVN